MTQPSNLSFSLAGQQHPSTGEHWIICAQINPLNWIFWATSTQQHLHDSASPYLRQIIPWEPCQERLYDTCVMDIKHTGAGIGHHHTICHHFDVSCPQHKGLGANVHVVQIKSLGENLDVTPANIPTSTVTLEKNTTNAKFLPESCKQHKNPQYLLLTHVFYFTFTPSIASLPLPVTSFFHLQCNSDTSNKWDQIPAGKIWKEKLF